LGRWWEGTRPAAAAAAAAAAPAAKEVVSYAGSD
jgi:hypothetical protein